MSSGAAHVTVVSPPSPDSGEWPAILARVEQALGPLPGPWQVRLSPGSGVGWWILAAYRDDGFECTLLLEGPLQQTATHIRHLVADALQRHAIGR